MKPLLATLALLALWTPDPYDVSADSAYLLRLEHRRAEMYRSEYEAVCFQHRDDPEVRERYSLIFKFDAERRKEVETVTKRIAAWKENNP